VSEVPAAVRRAPALPWLRRIVDVALAYLPMLVMAALALGSWWLVKQTPVAEGPTAASAPRSDPDYTMRTFVVQRFAKDGSLRTQIEGDVATHYPDTDILEIQNPRIRAIAANGRVTVASAERALANGDGSEVQLLHAAHVVREAAPGEEAIDFRSEFLHVFVNLERVQTHLPVRVTQGATAVEAGGMEYDHLARVIDLKPRIRGVFVDPGRLPLK
jgi:lipopolysaccharide export system protein LptC